MQPDTHVVVDLCCGSGSGCVAALRTGYHAIGIDRNVTQVEEARRRLQIFTESEVAHNARLDKTEEQFRDKLAKHQFRPATAAAGELVEVNLV